MICRQGPWRHVTLDDLGHWQGGSTPSKRIVAYWTNGDIPWVSPKDFGEMTVGTSSDKITDAALAESGATLLPPGALLIVTRSGVLRHSLPTAVTSAPVTINQDVKALVPVPSVRARFLQYQLEASADEVLQSTVKSGTTVESVDFEALRRFPVMITTGGEQDRIVRYLDNVFAKLDDCASWVTAALSRIDDLRAGALRSAFTGALTAGWRERHDAETAWHQIRLADVVSQTSYGSAKKSQANGDIAVLRMGNIQSGRLVWDDLVYTSDAAEIEKHRLKEGDVLFNRTNSPELVGKTAVYHGEHPAIAAGYLIVVRCGPNIMPNLLAHFLNSPAGRAYCWTVKSDGVSQSNVNARKLMEFEFGLPSLDEQRAIVLKVDRIFEILEATREDLADVANGLRTVRRQLLRTVFCADLNGDGLSPELDEMLAGAEAFRAGFRTRARKRKAKMANLTPLNEQITSIIKANGPNGATFEDICAKISADYEALKSEIFALLQCKPARLRQVFDRHDQIIKLKAVE